MSLFQSYRTNGGYDEVFQPDGQPRPHYRSLYAQLEALPRDAFRERSHAAASHSGFGSPELSLDLLPRLILAEEWVRLERGLRQRLLALNLFLQDIYHKQRIFTDRIVPRELVVCAPEFRPEFQGAEPPGGIYTPITSHTLIRDESGTYHVLADDLRAPEDIGYLEINRRAVAAALPDLLHDLPVQSLREWPAALRRNLRSLAPPDCRADSQTVLWSHATYEGSSPSALLAEMLGMHAVTDGDLYVDANRVYRQAVGGPQRVTGLYRLVEDGATDPLTLPNPEMRGVPGLVNAYRAGSVVLADAIGTGVAGSRALYAYVPRIIEYYLGEKPVLPNVETYLAWNPQHHKHIVDHLENLVIKPVHASTAEALSIGPRLNPSQRSALASRIEANPWGYIAQPFVPFSIMPVFVDDHFEAQPVDLRVYLLHGTPGITLVPGGLTRIVTRKENDSDTADPLPGGRLKDTWILAA